MLLLMVMENTNIFQISDVKRLILLIKYEILMNIYLFSYYRQFNLSSVR